MIVTHVELARVEQVDAVPAVRRAQVFASDDVDRVVPGGLQLVDGSGFYSVEGARFTVVPEPATLPALVSGLALLALANRRRFTGTGSS